MQQTVAKSKKPNPFAERLRSLREEADVTQSQAAEAASVHIQTYMRWERGETEPTFGQLLAIATLLGKTPNDFIPSDSG